MEFYNFKKKLEEKVQSKDKMMTTELNDLEKAINSGLTTTVKNPKLGLINYLFIEKLKDINFYNFIFKNQ